jgi:hypothetical protein
MLNVHCRKVSARNMYVAAVISTFELIGDRSEVAQHEDRVAAACCFVQQNERCILSRRSLLWEWKAGGNLETR